MVQKHQFRKGITLAVILLFFGVNINSSSNITVEKKSINSPIYSGSTIYVGGSGLDNYSRIQDAIDDASDGDTVFVYNGTYVENVVVDKSINLNGEDKNITIVDGNRSGDVVYITADWVNFSGFTIQDSGITGRCLLVLSSHNIIFNNNIVQNSSSYYFYVKGSDNVVTGNNISHIGNDYGRGLYFCSNNSNFSNNIVSNMKYFITSYNTIYLYDNIFSNCYDGIWCEGWIDKSVICGNVFSNIKGNAIDIRSFRGNKIINNQFLNNNFCILVRNCYDNIISHNFFQYNYNCIFLSHGMNNTISENSFIENEYAIFLWGANFNRIFNNNFIKNGENVQFRVLSLYNKWTGNYWGRLRLLPKPIIGRLGMFISPWINFDWKPAKVPYL